MGKATMTWWRCKLCGWYSRQAVAACGKCGRENCMAPSEPPPARPAPAAPREEESAESNSLDYTDDETVTLEEAIAQRGGKPRPRYKTGLSGFDRVLGGSDGGLARRSVVLLSGEPGCGKSTLLLTALANIAQRYPKAETLIATGEEASEQVAERAIRLGLRGERLHLIATHSMEAIEDAVDNIGARVLLVDSAQTVETEDVDGKQGSITQTVACVQRMMNLAHAKGGARCTVLVIGHASKDGSAAGPNTLKHLVDTVLSVTSDESSGLRTLIAEKNRFGPKGELSMFNTEEGGIREIADPGADLLAERKRDTSGSVLFAGAEDNSRPMLVELQALVAAPAGQSGQRVCVGVERTKLNTVVAILGRAAEIQLSGLDVYVNVSRGLRAAEPAVALPLALALLSSARDQAVPRDVAVFGEIALDGSVRSVPRARDRLVEAARLGMKRALVPFRNHEQDGPQVRDFIDTLPVGHVADLINYLDVWSPRRMTGALDVVSASKADGA